MNLPCLSLETDRCWTMSMGYKQIWKPWFYGLTSKLLFSVLLSSFLLMLYKTQSRLSNYSETNCDLLPLLPLIINGVTIMSTFNGVSGYCVCYHTVWHCEDPCPGCPSCVESLSYGARWLGQVLGWASSINLFYFFYRIKQLLFPPGDCFMLIWGLKEQNTQRVDFFPLNIPFWECSDISNSLSTAVGFHYPPI